MRQLISIAITLIVLLSQCSSPENRREDIETKDLNTLLPKVLFITTGINFEEKDPDLPKGIIVAIQTFNKRGIPVRLEPRDVLFDYDFLSKYNIIILSSSIGYHDADRKYSLTYMTDAELENLNKFVRSGGVIIAGDNIGRNYFDGTDRISLYHQLSPDNYPLARVFGVILKEKNMKGYRITGKLNNVFDDELLQPPDEDFWTLVSDSIISNDLKVLAGWEKNDIFIPAIIQNKFGKGISFLLASSGFIAPVSDIGDQSIDQIQAFYNYVIDEINKENNIRISLNPWPDAFDMAFCVTLNPQGKIDDYRFILNQLKKLDVKPVFFANGLMNDTIKRFLELKNAMIESSGYSYLNYTDLSYPVAINDILKNENHWDKKFDGFRFPYTTPNFTGLLSLDVHDYSYESSISANNIEFMHGSVFPYNIVFSYEKLYKSTDILEIAPTYHDDYFFLNKLVDNSYKSDNQIFKDVLLYEQYLQDFWEYGVKPFNGLMVYLGHPGLVGYSDTTFSSLKNLISKVKEDNTWITTIKEIATYRKNIEKFRFYVQEENEKYIICIEGPDNILIKDVTLNFSDKPNKIKCKEGKITLRKMDQSYRVIFEVFNGQVITVEK